MRWIAFFSSGMLLRPLHTYALIPNVLKRDFILKDLSSIEKTIVFKSAWAFFAASISSSPEFILLSRWSVLNDKSLINKSYGALSCKALLIFR